MKYFMTGLIVLCLFLLTGFITGVWVRVDHWMMAWGAIGCALGVILTGSNRNHGMGIRDDAHTRKVFLRWSFMSFMAAWPCLLVGIVMFYTMH